MKFLFLFVLFIGATATFSIKQTVNSEKDCAVLAEHIHKILLPHLIARGATEEQAKKILQDHTDCVPLSGTSGSNDGDK